MIEYKEAISQLLEEQLVHSLFGEADDDARFESDVCPECQQTVYVIAPPDGGHTTFWMYRHLDFQLARLNGNSGNYLEEGHCEIFEE